MQTSNRLLDDLARVANGAVAGLTGVKSEVEALVRQQLERLLADADLVPREEFDAMAEVARKAREEQEKLEQRVAALEKQLGTKVTPKSTAKAESKPAATRKAGKSASSSPKKKA